jgi:biotin carboxyl carrier protein
MSPLSRRALLLALAGGSGTSLWPLRAHALPARPLVFPRDHGAHPQLRTRRMPVGGKSVEVPALPWITEWDAAEYPPAPAIDLSRVSDADAARFLLQATFGPTEQSIAEVRQKGYFRWIMDQIVAVPASSHFQETMDDFNRNQTVGGNGNRDPITQAYQRPGGAHRQAAWWKNSVDGPDQLRQRVAFALSQIMVISDRNGTIAAWQEGAANYYDLLVNHAFGNFRDLLEQVSLSPMMGIYYASSSPSADPYVKEGDTVTAGQVIGLIEAMKVFNEIHSTVSGTVKKIVAEGGAIVNPGDPLMYIG